MSKKYKEQLNSNEWKILSKRIKEKNNWECENCQCSERQLHVHHIKYIQGRKAWEYNDNLLMCLCDDCHSFMHELVGKCFLCGNETKYILIDTCEECKPHYERIFALKRLYDDGEIDQYSLDNLSKYSFNNLT